MLGLGLLEVDRTGGRRAQVVNRVRLFLPCGFVFVALPTVFQVDDVTESRQDGQVKGLFRVDRRLLGIRRHGNQIVCGHIASGTHFISPHYFPAAIRPPR